MTATGPGCDYDGAAWLGRDFLDKWLRDLHGEVVFRFKCAESAGHAATTCAQQGRLSARQARHEPGHESRVQQRFRMTMGVNGHANILVVELEGLGFTS